MLKFPKQITVAVLCGAMCVSACQLPSPTTPSSQIASVTSDAYTKALYVAEAGFSGVTASLETAVDSGLLKGANAQKALDVYDKLKAQLNTARTSKQTADAVLAQTYIADLWAVLLAARH